MLILSLTNALALDCTGLDTNACNLTNDIIAHVNAEAGSTVVGDSESGRFASTAIYDRVLAIDTALDEENCNAASGTMGGTYTMTNKSWGGPWESEGSTGTASGKVKNRQRRWIGDYEGDLSGSAGDTFSHLAFPGNMGAFGGNWGDGFQAGFWVKVAGKNGIYYGVTGSCPASALDGWLGKPIGSPTAKDATLTVLGTGSGSLLGGDLSDPEDDGDEGAGPTDPSWNWVDVFANDEPGFQGGEFAYNVFDNTVGSSNAKWCCSNPTPESPLFVGYELAEPVRLTHFTIASGNDSTGRDPNWWHLEGSNDGSTWQPIYVWKSEDDPWDARNEVVLFDLEDRALPYRFFRYIVFDTVSSAHQINEIELFAE